MTIALIVCLSFPAQAQRVDEIRPQHVTGQTLRSVEKGLKFLAQSQSDNGSWENFPDGSTFPCAMASLAGTAFLAGGNTTTRGPYAPQVRKTVSFVLAQAGQSGLIADPRESSMSMYGHGFSLLFLSCVYGMEKDAARRAEISKVVHAAIGLTSQAQSDLGGWIYMPGGGDEGSVTVTQMQGLRAAHNAGFTVPQSTVEKAIRYLEACKTSEGGICYSYASRGGTRLPISAAAICCLYSAGEYESPLAQSCLTYVWGKFKSAGGRFGMGGGHDFYTHLYASQAFYQAGDEYWDDYFPKVRDNLIKTQASDGTWNGDGIGQIYGTSIGLIVLQLPYKFLPIYQR